MTDPNTIDDNWNEGFDDCFAGAALTENADCTPSAGTWRIGWHAAFRYSKAIGRPRPAPRSYSNRAMPDDQAHHICEQLRNGRRQ